MKFYAAIVPLRAWRENLNHQSWIEQRIAIHNRRKATNGRGVRVGLKPGRFHLYPQVAVVNNASLGHQEIGETPGTIGRDQAVRCGSPRHRENLALKKLVFNLRSALKSQV